MSGPAYHGRTHCPGGTDPIPCNLVSSGGVFETYRGCTLAREGLLAYWPLADPVGSTTAQEVVGARVTTVETGAGYPIFGVTGVFPGLPDETQAAFSNAGQGSNPANPDRLLCTLSTADKNATFQGTHAWAVEAWIYPTGTPVQSTGYIFRNFSGAGNVSQLTVNESGGILFVQGSRGAVAIGSTVLSPVPLVTETHVRLVFTGAALQLYIDGVLADSAAASASQTAGSTFSIGNLDVNPGTGFRSFEGRLAHVALYSQAVTSFCAPGGEGGGTDAPEFTTGWADGAGGVTWHLVQADNIEDEAVTTAAIAPNAVTAAKVAADVATQAELDAHISDPTGAHAASAISVADAGGYYTATEVEAALQEIGADLAAPGRWELVMQDGVTAPPVPVETEAQDDWVYVLVED